MRVVRLSGVQSVLNVYPWPRRRVMTHQAPTICSITGVNQALNAIFADVPLHRMRPHAAPSTASGNPSVFPSLLFTHNSQPVMSPSSLSPSHVLLLLPLHPPPSSQTPPSPAPSTSATLIKFAALTLASGVMSEPETVQSTSTRVKHRDPALY